MAFTCAETKGLNDPSKMAQDAPDDKYVMEVVHMPPIDLTSIVTTETQSPYINDLATYIKSWFDDPKQTMIVGSLRLHWLLQPNGYINGLLYCLMKGKNES